MGPRQYVEPENRLTGKEEVWTQATTMVFICCIIDSLRSNCHPTPAAIANSPYGERPVGTPVCLWRLNLCCGMGPGGCTLKIRGTSNIRTE